MNLFIQFSGKILSSTPTSSSRQHFTLTISSSGCFGERGTIMPPKWTGSYAQDLIYRDLRDGTIGPHMTAAQAQATRPEFLEYEDPNKFEEYFNKMRQKAIVAKDLSKKDYQGLMNDRVNHHPIEPFSEARGFPRWEGSDAEQMLKEHVGKNFKCSLCKSSASTSNKKSAW
jgi:hypothetical protein